MTTSTMNIIHDFMSNISSSEFNTRRAIYWSPTIYSIRNDNVNDGVWVEFHLHNEGMIAVFNGVELMDTVNTSDVIDLINVIIENS